MTLNEYQQEALTTATYPDEFKTIYPAIGLNGEAGEVAEKVKRIIRDTDYKKDGSGALVVTEIKALNIAAEIGDVLWYCATLAHDIGFTLDDVARINVNKLRDRARRGLISGEGDYR